MERIPELHGPRGIAALVIAVFRLRFTGRYPTMATTLNLSFVLSGQPDRDDPAEDLGPDEFRNLFWAQALRIFSIDDLAFAIYLLVHPFFHRPGPLEGLPYSLSYAQDLPRYWRGEAPEFGRLLAQTWAPAIEEQLDLVRTILVAASGRRRLVPIVAALLAMPLLARSPAFYSTIPIAQCDRHFGVTRGSPWMDGLRFLAALGLVALTWRLVERPILRQKDQFADEDALPGSGKLAGLT